MPQTPRVGITLEPERPRSRGRTLAGRLVMLALAGTVAVGGWAAYRQLSQSSVTEGCRVTVNSQTFEWATDQASNAAVITAIGVERGLPPRAASIAIATAMQESKVRNIRYGDRDSVGLFQQRPSQGWGTVEQIMNPEYATTKFYDALEKVDGYREMEIAVAAQAVQRSADGSAYAQHEAMARATASALSGQTPAAFGCALADVKGTPDGSLLTTLLKADHGLPATSSGRTITVVAPDKDRAWSVGQWAVARAKETGAVRVQVRDQVWTRALSERAYTWGEVGASIAPNTVVITLARG